MLVDDTLGYGILPHLKMPSWHLLEIALDRLLAMGVVAVTQRGVGVVRGLRISLHTKLMHSDIVSALVNDPMQNPEPMIGDNRTHVR